MLWGKVEYREYQNPKNHNLINKMWDVVSYRSVFFDLLRLMLKYCLMDKFSEFLPLFFMIGATMNSSRLATIACVCPWREKSL